MILHSTNAFSPAGPRDVGSTRTTVNFPHCFNRRHNAKSASEKVTEMHWVSAGQQTVENYESFDSREFYLALPHRHTFYVDDISGGGTVEPATKKRRSSDYYPGRRDIQTP